MEQIPYSTEQGIFLSEQGICLREQGISVLPRAGCRDGDFAA
jgi:hypothetical protein